MKMNQTLGIAAAACLLLSGWTYYDSVTRAERFERGQKFIPNLNPDEIAEILVKKGDEETLLKRQGEEFVLAGANGYPATNEAVNRFIRDVLDMSLEKEVGSGESLEEELELSPAGDSTVDVTFKDSNDKTLVHFLIGKASDGAGGNFVARADSDDRTVYLSSKQSYLRTANDDFLKKQIADVKGEDITSIIGGDYQVTNEDGTFKLADVPSGKKESSKVNSAQYMLSSLRFDKHYLADAPEVRSLAFNQQIQVDLNDDSGYRLALAESGEKHYLQVQAYYNAQEVSISRDADEEVAKETADKLERIDEVNDFNSFHGSWIYEIGEGTANKLNVTRSDLLEDA